MLKADTEEDLFNQGEKDRTVIFADQAKFKDEKSREQAEELFSFRHTNSFDRRDTVGDGTVMLDENNEETWEPLMETILRGEFSDFEEYKFVRKRGEGYVKLIHFTRLIIHNMFFISLMYIAIAWALFANNCRLLFFGNASDTPFDVLTIIVLVIFAFDFIINIIGALDYIISFYFWTDIISIIVLIFDLAMVRNRIFFIDATINKSVSYQAYFIIDILRLVRLMKVTKNFFLRKYTWRYEYFKKFFGLPEKRAKVLVGDLNPEIDGEGLENSRLKSIRKSLPLAARQSISNNFLTKAIRTQNNKSEDKKSGEVVGGFKSRDLATNFVYKSRKFKESRIARRVLYLTNKRIMMLFLAVLICLPMFSIQFWTKTSLSYEKDLLFLELMYQNDPILTVSYIETDFLQTYIEYHSQVLKIKMGREVDRVFDQGLSLRPEEIFTWSEVGSGLSLSPKEISISVRPFVKIQALLNIMRVIFVFILLFIRIYYFHKEAREKILDPLERLLEKIRLMAKNPSRALAMGKGYQEMKNTDLMIIEDTIQKISYLLVLGFGEAGNSILSKILYSKEMEIDFLSKPNTVYAIFGFCDIRNFTDATEALVEDVLEFVNKIAKIVHGEVSSNEGGANKNIGDAFLVVWKLKNKGESDVCELTKPNLTPEEKLRIESRYSSMRRPTVENENQIREFRMTLDTYQDSVNLMDKYYNNLSNSSVAELSLISFLKIMSKLTTNKEILEYNKNPKLLKAVPGFKVNMGFGLHAGWAIEGAIGSNLKIDMSYLSPNVNMSSRLEGLTKVYGVPLLFTSSLFNLFTTSKIKDLCRMVDRFYISGTSDSYELYTVDTFPSELEKENDVVELKNSTFDLISNKNIRIDNLTKSYIALERKLEKENGPREINEEINEDEYIDYVQIERMWEYVIMDEDLIKLLKIKAKPDEAARYNKTKRIYEAGMQEYIARRWTNAKDIFEKVMNNGDKRFASVKAIYDFMKTTDFEAPKEFLNAREHS
jgi:class 3 adenylate cyclase